jgi:hypothetical protein
MTEEALEKIEIVYLGKRMVKGDKIAHAFILPATLEKIVDDGEKHERERFKQDITERIDRAASLFTAVKGPASIGGVYEGKGLVENGLIVSLVPSGLAWRRSVDGNAATFIPAFRVLHDAVELEKRRKAAEKNAVVDKAFINAVAVLRDRYRKIPGGYRRGFMLWLQDELGKI